MSSQLHTPHPNAERFHSLNAGTIYQIAFLKAQLRPCKLSTSVLESKVLAVDCGLPSGASLPLQNASQATLPYTSNTKLQHNGQLPCSQQV